MTLSFKKMSCWSEFADADDLESNQSAQELSTVDLLIMHSSMHYEITTKSIQLFAESVQNPNMHYEIFYAL